MPDLLYLDTARVGQIAPSAHRALTDYLRLNAEQGLPLYFDQFFEGTSELFHSLVADYEGLRCWKGTELLRHDIRSLFDAHPESDVWFASRSAVLMDLAARLMFRRCRNVLITDLTWPRYESILRAAVPNLSCKVTKVNISDQIYSDKSGNEIVEHVVGLYRKTHCDGLFLPLVSNHGIHLPVKKLVGELRSVSQLRFVCLDVAQAINHVPICAKDDYFDFAIGGSHKWLRSFIPLAIGLSGSSRTREFIKDSQIRWTQKNLVGDPIHTFTTQLASGLPETNIETINPTPLVACSGALSDRLCSVESEVDSYSAVGLRDEIETQVAGLGLKLRKTHPDFWTKILSFCKHERSSSCVTRTRKALLKNRIVTSVVGDALRISIPLEGLTGQQLACLHSAGNSSAKRTK